LRMKRATCAEFSASHCGKMSHRLRSTEPQIELHIYEIES